MSLALLCRVCPEPEVGEPPPALGWASTPSILRVCVSLCWSGIAAWGFLLRSSSPIAPGRGPEKRPGPSTCVPLAEPSDTPRPYFFFQGPRPPSCTVGVSMSRVDTPTWLGARPCHPAPCSEPSKGSSLPGLQGQKSHTQPGGRGVQVPALRLGASLFPLGPRREAGARHLDLPG